MQTQWHLPLAVMKEGSTGSLTQSFYDDEGDPVTPTSIKYRIDCDTNDGQEVQVWTTIDTPLSTITISILPQHTAIIDETNDTETKRLTVVIDENMATQHTDEITYTVERLAYFSVGDDVVVDVSDSFYNPGHYILPRGIGNVVNSDFNSFISNPDVVGAQVRIQWAKLEPAEDVYDFSMVRSHMLHLAEHGKRLVLQIQIKSFNINAKLFPAYLQTNPAYGGGAVETLAGPGWVAMLWYPPVAERLIKLVDALAAEFNDNQYFEGINFNESILGLWPNCVSPPGGYTATAYRDALKTIMTAAKAAFTKSTVLQFLNAIDCGSYTLAVAQHCASVGGGFGGPDIRPGNDWLVNGVYKIYPQVSCVKGTAVQWDNLAAPDGYLYTAEDLFLYGRDTLGLDYIFWEIREPYYSDDVLPVITQYNDFNK